jgi:hypothetical protein
MDLPTVYATSGGSLCPGSSPPSLKDRVGDFLRAHRAAGHPNAAGHHIGVSDRSMAPILRYLGILGYLRCWGFASPSTVALPATPMEQPLFEYRRYLEDERGRGPTPQCGRARTGYAVRSAA